MSEFDSQEASEAPESQTPGVDSSHQNSNRRYALQFVGIFVWSLSCIAAFNYLVDPYAHYRVGLVPPAVQLTRALKVQGIEHVAADTTALILGSSRVLKLEPEFVSSIDGERYYNAGVNYARPEDWYALTNLYKDTYGKLPKKVLIGVDVASFNENLPIDDELVGLTSLTKYLDGKMRVPPTPGKWKELVSFQYTRNSLRALRHYIQSSNNQAEQLFHDNGTIVYTKREAEIENHTYDFQSAIDYNKNEYAAIFSGYDRIGETRWLLFKELVEILRASGTEVNLFLTPDHPELAQSLAAIPNYRARTSELDERLRTLSSDLKICYKNLQSIESFDGDAKQFVDGIHPLEPNTRRMVRKILCEENREIDHAIQ